MEFDFTNLIKWRFWSKVNIGEKDDCWPWTAGCAGMLEARKQDTLERNVMLWIRHEPMVAL